MTGPVHTLSIPSIDEQSNVLEFTTVEDPSSPFAATAPSPEGSADNSFPDPTEQQIATEDVDWWCDDVPPLPSPRWVAELTGHNTDGDADEGDESTVGRTLLDAGDDADLRYLTVRVPAETAYELGFIDRARATQLIDTARLNTTARMASAISRAPAALRPQLTSAMADPALFAQLAHSEYLQYREELPLWGWYVHSLAHEIEQGTAAHRLRWLAAYIADLNTRELAHSMYETSMAAARKYWYLYEEP